MVNIRGYEEAMIRKDYRHWDMLMSTRNKMSTRGMYKWTETNSTERITSGSYLQ